MLNLTLRLFSTPEPCLAIALRNFIFLLIKMNNALLFLVFNRPDTTRKVFNAIRDAKPPRLYIAADGHRPDCVGEDMLCDEVRKIATSVDWACEVKTLFRDRNLGCKKGVSSGINWFFQHEEQGIILEDDVLPHPDFFSYCDNLLLRYKYDLRVMMLCGFNPDGANIESDNYFFSENPSVWGWATWRSRWKLYDLDLKNWPSESFDNYLKTKFSLPVYTYYKKAFNLTKKGIINSWDYQWTYCMLSNYSLAIKPSANLVMNIGTEGTHSKRPDHNHFVAYGIVNPEKLKCDGIMVPDVRIDHTFYASRISGGILFYLKRFLNLFIPGSKR